MVSGWETEEAELVPFLAVVIGGVLAMEEDVAVVGDVGDQGLRISRRDLWAKLLLTIFCPMI